MAWRRERRPEDESRGRGCFFHLDKILFCGIWSAGSCRCRGIRQPTHSTGGRPPADSGVVENVKRMAKVRKEIRSTSARRGSERNG